MKVKISKPAKKFLLKTSQKEKDNILQAIKKLFHFIKSNHFIPYQEMDIKILTGEWKGFMRLRVGKIRIIFDYDKEKEILNIYNIHHRGKVY